jgi:cell division protein FtsI/penicillin-binding protein 2
MKPKVVVAVLLVRQGAGGSTAAPAARIVLGRALGK